MNFLELKSAVRAILNRSDATDADLKTWINNALSRSAMKLRLPPNETQVTSTVTVATDRIDVPTDYMELIDLSVNDDYGLIRTSLDGVRLHSLDGNIGTPRVFARVGNEFIIAPSLKVDDEVTLTYMADAAQTKFTSDEDQTILSSICPYLYVFGALINAGHRFQDDRRAEWQAEFDRLVTELDASAREEAFSGGTIAVQSAYPRYED
jgi:hypothetical protein